MCHNEARIVDGIWEKICTIKTIYKLFSLSQNAEMFSFSIARPWLITTFAVIKYQDEENKLCLVMNNISFQAKLFACPE